MLLPEKLQQLPFSDWPQSEDARAWLIEDVLPFAGIPLLALIVLPALLLLSMALMACGARKRLGRSRGLYCASAGMLMGLGLLGGAIYALFMLLAAATAIESTAVNITIEASQFTCRPLEGSEHISTAEFGLRCADGPPAPWQPLSCARDSLIGFIDSMAASTEAATITAVEFVSSLKGAVSNLEPVVGASAALVEVGDSIAGNFSTLNDSLHIMRSSLSSVCPTARPGMLIARSMLVVRVQAAAHARRMRPCLLPPREATQTAGVLT